MASVATEEAIGGSTRGGEGEGFLLGHFEAEAAALGHWRTSSLMI